MSDPKERQGNVMSIPRVKELEKSTAGRPRVMEIESNDLLGLTEEVLYAWSAWSKGRAENKKQRDRITQLEAGILAAIRAPDRAWLIHHLRRLVGDA